MEILFQDQKLEKICNNQSLLVKKHGSARAKILRRRLDDLRAVENLEVMHLIPKGRCHELKGNRKGELAIDLDGPYRLIFEPANNPVPIKSDGGLDRTKVTVIRVLAVEDYHD
jgi:plasmid maintenance system killer protein